MENENECAEAEKVEDAKTDCNYNPAGNTANKNEKESDSKTDEFGKRKRNVDGSKKVNPSS